MQNLILLHGALGSKKELAPIHELLKPYFNCWMMEFSGHGETPASQDFSIPRFAQELKDFIAKHQLKEVLVFGFSMGGYVALKAALTCPEIKQIITLGTKFDWSNESLTGELKKLNPRKIQEKVPAFAKYLSDLHQAFWVQNMEKTVVLMQMINEKDHLTPDQLAQIDIPVQLLLGSLDDMVGEEETKTIAKALAHGTMEVVPHWKHPLFMLKPEAIADKLLHVLGLTQA